ncbi:MAG TPA: MaoC family dehydratase N-terminal domain-containing protein [Usitatibacteraceae bacterium]|nr:MaoC family dehydratase N-terminal domain-containing protein [Usitatibacteraceae bacterium]
MGNSHEDGFARLADWIGRTETRTDTACAAPVMALAALLDRDDAPARTGDAIPPLAHWLYFLPMHRQSEMGPDGHAKRGEFLPPVPLPRRMWAGSRLEFLRPVAIGAAIRRVSRIAGVKVKEGRTGPLVFVTVRHEVSDTGGLAIADEHDIVYRGDTGRAVAEAVPAAKNEAWSRVIHPDPALLFRYSAVTFNGHRIHYDHPYVTKVEGYPGLVVHGPLIATLLVDLLRRSRPEACLRSFAFRAIRPLFDTAPFTVCGLPDDPAPSATLWTRDAEGAVTMEATATWQ